MLTEFKPKFGIYFQDSRKESKEEPVARASLAKEPESRKAAEDESLKIEKHNKKRL